MKTTVANFIIFVRTSARGGLTFFAPFSAATAPLQAIVRRVKLGIISDIHSNREALTAVFDALDEVGVDRVYCLGDVVGYGADPVACVDLVRERCAGVVRGNHDEAVALERNVAYLPRDGQAAAAHNRLALRPDQITYLSGLPYTLVADGCTFAHATPANPEFWERLESYVAAQSQFDHFDTEICFIGHTHFPAILADRIGILRVRRGHRFLVNVGSVGQPRDHNPRACFAVFDTETFACDILRVPYDVDAAVARIREEGLPARLGERLKAGV